MLHQRCCQDHDRGVVASSSWPKFGRVGWRDTRCHPLRMHVQQRPSRSPADEARQLRQLRGELVADTIIPGSRHQRTGSRRQAGCCPMLAAGSLRLLDFRASAKRKRTR
jgi:hypothetical protein